MIDKNYAEAVREDMELLSHTYYAYNGDDIDKLAPMVINIGDALLQVIDHIQQGESNDRD